MNYQDAYVTLLEELAALGEAYETIYDHAYAEERLFRADCHERNESFWVAALSAESAEDVRSGTARGIQVMVCNNTLSGWFCGSVGRATSVNGRLVMEPFTESDGYLRDHAGGDR